MDTPPEHFRHPTMGRFTKTDDNDYVRTVRTGGRAVRLILYAGHLGPGRVTELAGASAAAAARIYGRLDRITDVARSLASRRCLASANVMREAEGKPPLTREDFEKRLKLLDVGVGPDGGTVALTAKNAYANEHSLIWVKLGPRGAPLDAYVV